MQDNRNQAIELLKTKYETLGRIPKKADMSEEEIIMIKSILGPWPRALEAACIKEAVKIPKNVVNKRRRRRTKERKKQYNEGNYENEEQN